MLLLRVGYGEGVLTCLLLRVLLICCLWLAVIAAVSEAVLAALGLLPILSQYLVISSVLLKDDGGSHVSSDGL